MAAKRIANDIRAHSLRNRALRESLVKRNVDLTVARPAEFQFWAWSQRDAAVLARELYGIGFLVRLLAPAPDQDEEDRWAVEAGARIPIEEALSDSLVTKLVELARKCDAEFDGWGTQI
jgi:hypothetical protein